MKPELNKRRAQVGGGINKFARAIELLTAAVEHDERDTLVRAIANLLRGCGARWTEGGGCTLLVR